MRTSSEFLTDSLTLKMETKYTFMCPGKSSRHNHFIPKMRAFPERSEIYSSLWNIQNISLTDWILVERFCFGSQSQFSDPHTRHFQLHSPLSQQAGPMQWATSQAWSCSTLPRVPRISLVRPLPPPLSLSLVSRSYSVRNIHRQAQGSQLSVAQI